MHHRESRRVRSYAERKREAYRHGVRLVSREGPCSLAEIAVKSVEPVPTPVGTTLFGELRRISDPQPRVRQCMAIPPQARFFHLLVERHLVRQLALEFVAAEPETKTTVLLGEPIRHDVAPSSSRTRAIAKNTRR